MVMPGKLEEYISIARYPKYFRRPAREDISYLDTRWRTDPAGHEQRRRRAASSPPTASRASDPGSGTFVDALGPNGPV